MAPGSREASTLTANGAPLPPDPQCPHPSAPDSMPCHFLWTFVNFFQAHSEGCLPREPFSALPVVPTRILAGDHLLPLPLWEL